MSRRAFIRSGAALGIAGALLMSDPLRADAVAINPRSSWATNRPPKGPLSGEDVKFLLVHHSASHNGHTGTDAPGILRSFYDFHTGPEKGWNDIAYNFLIDADGGIWEGRSGSLAGPVAGDATGGNQGFSQLVCVIGDYNSASPSVASKNSLAVLLAWLADRYGVNTSPGATVSFVSRGSNLWPAGSSVITPTITGHRRMSKTTCPGENLYAYVTTSLVSDVNAARSGSTPAPTAPSAPSPTGLPTTVSPSVTSTSEKATTSTVGYTTTVRDSLPSTLSTPPFRVTASTTPESTSTAVTLPTTTTMPLLASATQRGPGASPLIWGGLGLAGLLSGLLAWRLRRLGG